MVIDGTYSEEQDLTISVPQGSCAGVNIFNLYCAPLEEVVTPSLKISRLQMTIALETPSRQATERQNWIALTPSRIA